MKNVVIVESPAKAKTIEKYLGAGYRVVASFGHVRDLPSKGMSIDIEHDFAPHYEVSPDKKKTITELRKLAKDADTVWLASDEDREGEAIAWHLSETLSLKPANTKRIVFHEITEPAIRAAIANPRTINMKVVDAQQARRVLDRLVGYELSPVLWKKVQPGLSAGRVQSVAVRLIVEREREIENFTSKAQFKVTAEFEVGDGRTLRAELDHRLDAEEAAATLLNAIAPAKFSVDAVEKKPTKRTPAAPFTTSTLQQEASRKLGFSVRQTMTLAQRLYEAGHITYMRTDSLNLSSLAIAAAAKQITKSYGQEYLQTRTYKTKSAGAQEAHEAIRPTDFGVERAGADAGAQRLYELIWKRTVASQMAEAKLEKTIAWINNDKTPDRFKAEGEVVLFDGFLKLYLESNDDEDMEEAGVLPPLSQGQTLPLLGAVARQIFGRPKPRYTEASLVKKLEESGIGRPSTYAPTISTIQDRGYVEKGDLEGTQREVIQLTLKGNDVSRQVDTETTGADRNKLLPTDIGILVTDFLVKYFAEVVDIGFTAKVEEEFDDIAKGEKAWNAMIKEFYTGFHQTVTDAEGISRETASGARQIGTDPATGRPVIARMGRYGPMLQLGHAEDDEKPVFAPLPTGKRIADVTLDEALELFKLPRVLGETAEGESIAANFGRFGPFIKYGSSYVSIKPDDPFTITLERALQLIADKKTADAAKNIQSFDGSDIKVLNGRFGPYVTDGKKNAKIPKDQDPAKLTLAECQALIEAAPAAKKRRVVRRRSK